MPVTGPALGYEVVDVFTDRAYAGNPLAVVLGAAGLPTSALQAIAREFNLSETAFPLPSSAAGADYDLRIFTPYGELPFAGHPSVGAAWVLAARGEIRPGLVRQRCAAGVLPLRVSPGGGPVELTAATPAVLGPIDAGALARALRVGPDELRGAPPLLCSAGLPQALVEVAAPVVARVAPDPVALAGLAGGAWETVSVFAWDAGRRVAHARVFTPQPGVPEDPATGSAACALGVWLAASGYVPGDGETAYVVEQGTEIGRPSRLECAVVTEGGVAVECRVRGGVVPVARGTLLAPGLDPRG